MQSESGWVIMPAAGNGQRFKQSLPKQYTLVHGKTILEHSADIFLKLPWIKKIVLGIAPDDEYISCLPLSQKEKIQIVAGGTSRAQTVLNAIKYLEPYAQSNDWILVHDAVRPCLHPADLHNLIEQLQTSQTGGILASPVADTLKQVKDLQVQTVDRTYLWRALTPQMFRFSKIKAALLYCLEQQVPITDEASALEKFGQRIKLVQAQYANPKLTFPADLQFIEHLLQQSINEVTAP